MRDLRVECDECYRMFKDEDTWFDHECTSEELARAAAYDANEHTCQYYEGILPYIVVASITTLVLTVPALIYLSFT
jgi:hypothetical protein